MAKDPQETHFKSHHWVMITHKRGIAKYCMNCGKIRYYGRQKDWVKSLKELDESVMVYQPNALAPAHGLPPVGSAVPGG